MTTEDTTAAPSPAPAEPAAPETPSPSLEQIASEFSVDDQATNFTAQPPAPSAPPLAPPPVVPDPITDGDAYRQYMAYQASVSDRLQGTLQAVNQRLESFERQQQQVKIDADITHAVTKVNEKLKADPELVEAMLNVQYQKDAAFKKIWNNRDKNPAAFERALSVIADKLAPRFQVRQDPQLTENQRAAKASTKTIASTAKSDYDPRYKGLYEPESQGEFEQAWEAMKRGMIPG